MAAIASFPAGAEDWKESTRTRQYPPTDVKERKTASKNHSNQWQSRLSFNIAQKSRSLPRAPSFTGVSCVFVVLVVFEFVLSCLLAHHSINGHIITCIDRSPFQTVRYLAQIWSSDGICSPFDSVFSNVGVVSVLCRTQEDRKFYFRLEQFWESDHSFFKERFVVHFTSTAKRDLRNLCRYWSSLSACLKFRCWNRLCLIMTMWIKTHIGLSLNIWLTPPLFLSERSSWPRVFLPPDVLSILNVFNCQIFLSLPFDEWLEPSVNRNFDAHFTQEALLFH
jgi:hypothetical protein